MSVSAEQSGEKVYVQWERDLSLQGVHYEVLVNGRLAETVWGQRAKIKAIYHATMRIEVRHLSPAGKRTPIGEAVEFTALMPRTERERRAELDAELRDRERVKAEAQQRLDEENERRRIEVQLEEDALVEYERQEALRRNAAMLESNPTWGMF